MKRRAQPQAAASVSLFPFLAVLLCTMGALIVLLVVIAQQARAQAARAAAAEAQRHDDSAAETEAQWRSYQAQIEELDGRLGALRRELAERHRSTAAVDEELQAARSALRDLDERRRALNDKLAGVADEDETDELRRQIGAYRKRIDEVGEEIRQSRFKQPGSAFAIVPYVGPSGTQRRPIYIECRRDAVVLQPEGTILRAADFPTVLGRVPQGNPLEAALLATIQHWERSSGNSGAKAYPMLLVRPDGIETYEVVLSALGYASGQQRFDFGYELVEADWDLAFDAPNQELAARQADAAAQARQVVVARYGNRGLRIPSAGSGTFADDDEVPPGFGYRVSSEGGGLEAVGRDGLSMVSMPDPYGPMGYGQGGNEYGQLDRAFPTAPGEAPSASTRYGEGTAPSFTGGGSQGEENPYTLFGGGDSEGADGVATTPYGTGELARRGNANSAYPSLSGSEYSAGATNSLSSGDRYGQNTPGGGNNSFVGGAGGEGEHLSEGGGAGSPATRPPQSASSGPALGGPSNAEQRHGQSTPSEGEEAEYISGGESSAEAMAGGTSSQSSGGGTTASSGAANGPTQSSQQSAPVQGGSMSMAVEERGQLPTQPLSQERGQDWALQHGHARSSAIWRYITVVVDDELVWVATGGSGPAAWKAIPYNGATFGAVGTLQRTVLEIMNGWGLAGRGMHWRPVLSAQVTSRGEARFRDLQTLLHESGFKLERKAGPSAYQPGTAEAKE